MARTPSASGMLDIRSAAILQDIQYAEGQCKPGSDPKLKHRYYGSLFFRDLPEFSQARNPAFYDQARHWVVAGSAFLICFIILGLIHTIPLLHNFTKLKYGIGDVEIVVISAATYAILLLFGPLATWSVRSIGQRLTCMFGLLLFFLGLIVDGLVLHIATYYLAHLVLLGIGGSFALTGAISSVSPFFRIKLHYALALIVCASPVGTAFFAVVLYFLSTQTTLSYTWIFMTLAFIVLISISLTHTLPTSITPARHPNPFYYPKKKHEGIKDCITNASGTETESKTGHCQPDKEESFHKSCLCVCICDISILTDCSFFLWSAITCAAMISIYIPYLFLYCYAVDDLGLDIWDGICLIFWFCMASLAARIGIQLDDVHTFAFNRMLFQIALLISGILYIFLSHAETYGWLLVWCMVMGAIEGIFIGVIPRVTLSTIPRRQMVSSWTYIVIMHGISLFIGAYLIIAIRNSTGGDITLACIIIGVIHIVGGILSFILPNEEDSGEDYEAGAMGSAQEEFNYFGGGYSSTGNGYIKPCECKNQDIFMNDTKITYPQFTPTTQFVPSSFCCGGADGYSEYCANCPVCSKLDTKLDCLEPNPCFSSKSRY